jgi:integrase
MAEAEPLVNKRRQRRGHNEGTIGRLPNGKWWARIDLGWVNGRRKRKAFYADTRAEVAGLLTKALRLRQQGLPVAFERQTVEQFLGKWLEFKRSSLRPRSYERIEGICRLHIIPAFGKVTLHYVAPQQIQELLTTKLKEGLSPQSVKHIRQVLNSALKRALKWQMVGRNSAALTDAPRIEREPVQPLTVAEARRLLQYAAADRLEAVYSVALAIGLRRGETLGIKWEDIDLDAGIIRISRSLQRTEHKLQLLPPKTRQSARAIRLPDVAIKALRKHRARQLEDRLAAGNHWTDIGLCFTTRIGTPLEPRNVSRSFKALLKRADIPESRFHDLRHTAASLLLAQGVHPRVVMEILGHSRISLTMDTYSHVMPAALSDAASRMDDILNAQ